MTEDAVGRGFATCFAILLAIDLHCLVSAQAHDKDTLLSEVSLRELYYSCAIVRGVLILFAFFR